MKPLTLVAVEVPKTLPHFQIDESGDDSEDRVRELLAALQERKVKCACCDAEGPEGMIGKTQTPSGMRLTYLLCGTCTQKHKRGSQDIKRRVEQRFGEEAIQYGAKVPPAKFGH
jgi:hypothetical protein